MGTGPFRPARTQPGGGTGVYDLPPDLSGQTYDPGSAVWNYIAQNYNPIQWTQISPDTKRIIVSHAVDATTANAAPGTLAHERLYDEAYNPARHSRAFVPDRGILTNFLSGLNAYTQSPARNLGGLFGDAGPDTAAPTRDEINHRGRAQDERNAFVQAQMSAPPVAQHPMPDFSDLIRGFLNGRKP